MAKITEDYVSFETAKLLKEKGFNEPTVCVYHKDGTFERVTLNAWNDKFITPICAPSQSFAMKWLREVHNIGIFPSTYTHISDRKTIHSYGTAIINLKTYELMTDSYLSNDTYEEACEAAIKYCLENLI